MNIDIICVGKLKEKYFTDGVNEYKKRLSRFCKINIIEVPDLKIPENASEKQIAELLIKEGEGILRCVKNNAYVIALCVEAKQMSSEEFAKTLKTLMDNSVSDIAFIIGGSMGLSEEVKKRANLKLGISQMTLPHQMARLVLIEQIYRAFKILNNETYHK